jgi:hypothetical protein
MIELLTSECRSAFHHDVDRELVQEDTHLQSRA